MNSTVHLFSDRTLTNRIFELFMNEYSHNALAFALKALQIISLSCI